MYILKKIFKNKNKPFFGKTSNDKYENMFIVNRNELIKNDTPIIIGIIQELSDGKSMVVAGIYNDNSLQHIEKDGKTTEFNISNKSFLKSKEKVFDLTMENYNQIKEFDKGKQSFLKEKGIRFTFLTSDGIYSIQGQFNDFNKGLFLPHILSLFFNIIVTIDKNRTQKITNKLIKKAANNV